MYKKTCNGLKFFTIVKKGNNGGHHNITLKQGNYMFKYKQDMQWF